MFHLEAGEPGLNGVADYAQGAGQEGGQGKQDQEVHACTSREFQMSEVCS